MATKEGHSCGTCGGCLTCADSAEQAREGCPGRCSCAATKEGSGEARYQLNTSTIVDGGETWRARFEVGRALRFVGYNPDELTPEDQFQRGDILRPVERNGCGMGIDVVRDGDGYADMVWPEEVDLATASAAPPAGDPR